MLPLLCWNNQEMQLRLEVITTLDQIFLSVGEFIPEKKIHDRYPSLSLLFVQSTPSGFSVFSNTISPCIGHFLLDIISVEYR